MTLRRTTKWMAVPLAVAAAVALWVVRAGWHGSFGRTGHAGGGNNSTAGLDVAQANDLAVENWTRASASTPGGPWDLTPTSTSSPTGPRLYQRYRLAYLHARARIAHGDLDGGRKALEPFLAAGDPFRDLALFYAAQAAQAEGKKDEAARLRETLVLEFPKATYRQSALEDLTAFLTEKRNAAALTELSRKITGTVEPSVQRDLESRAIAARLAGGDEASMADGLRFLRGRNLADDAA